MTSLKVIYPVYTIKISNYHLDYSFACVRLNLFDTVELDVLNHIILCLNYIAYKFIYFVIILVSFWIIKMSSKLLSISVC